MDGSTRIGVALAEHEQKADDADYKRLHDAIDEARATTQQANATATTAKTLNDPESSGRARVQAILLFEAAFAQWGNIARFVASQKKAMDTGASDERTTLAEAMEQHETELREDGVIVDIGTEHHSATLADARLVVEVVDEDLLPDDVFVPDKNKIARRFKEHGRCPGARLVKGKRFVQIRLKSEGTSRRGNGRNEAGEAGNE